MSLNLAFICSGATLNTISEIKRRIINLYISYCILSQFYISHENIYAFSGYFFYSGTTRVLFKNKKLLIYKNTILYVKSCSSQ